MYVFVGITLLYGAWMFLSTLGSDTASVSTPTTYPRIVGESGVWVEEYGDFEMAVVLTAPNRVGLMDMQEAKKIAVDARR